MQVSDQPNQSFVQSPDHDLLADKSPDPPADKSPDPLANKSPDLPADKSPDPLANKSPDPPADKSPDPPKPRVVLGIDLGTTNSCVSIWRSNTCEIIPDEHGNRTIPSYVSVTNVSRYIGNEAKKQKDINIENVFYETKRLIGREYNDPAVQDCKALLSYTIAENDRKCVSICSTVRSNKQYTPEEISACVLARLKDNATAYIGYEVTEAVITVPAHFNDSQRQATRDAASIAGLDCIRMIHEPTAAALAYGMMNRTLDKDTRITIMVYDFGGGTLDVSLIECFDGCFNVIASSGISHFGGSDFDNRLMNFCIAKFAKQAYNDTRFEPTNLSRLSLQQLRAQCESAKKILSTNTTAIIAIKDFHDQRNLFVKINRTDFENLVRDLFLLCISPIDDLLKECNLLEDEVNEIILVGGMTKMPYIRELLGCKFRPIDGVGRVNCSINPDEAVAVGAAIQGSIIAGHGDFTDTLTLMDVAPLSLGVEVIGGVMDVLIRRNTMIPVEKKKMYSTCDDNMDSVLIKIFEGERSLTAHNFKVGEFELHGIPLTRRGVPEIEVCFSIDNNGIVTVTACEQETEQKQSIVVNTNKNGLKPHELRVLIEEASEQEHIDEVNRVKKFSHYELEDLCANILENTQNKDYRLTTRDIETISADVNGVVRWLRETNYSARDLEEYEQALHRIKNKYGVLILCGKMEKTTVKANAPHLDATTVYGKDDDEDEEEMRQAFEKVAVDTLGSEGMSDIEISELKEARESLMGLCHSISQIIGSEMTNISKEHRLEVQYCIDDVMMWYYSHEKPQLVDYREKIDYVNRLCDEIVESYEKDQKQLFVDHMASDGDVQRLEKLCLALATMIRSNQISGSKAKIALLGDRVERALEYVYGVPDANMCAKYMDEINQMCDQIYNGLSGVWAKTEPIVSFIPAPIPVGQSRDTKGMSVSELMRLKQTQEIEQMIGADDRADDMIVDQVDQVVGLQDN
jgi:heat shock protein 1/8